MMHRSCSKRTLISIVAAGLLQVLAVDLRADVPMVLYASWPYVDKTYPTWVEATAAITPDGRLNPALFLPGYVEDLQRFIDTAPESPAGCLPYSESYGDVLNPPDRSTPEKLVRTSEAVVVGVVTARAFGFQFTVPGQMLEIEVLDVLPRRSTGDRLYVFLPVARFEVAGKVVCKTDSNYAPPPGTGERVALFLPDASSGPDPYLDLRFPSSLVTLRAEDVVVSGEVQRDGKGWSDASPGERVIPRSRFDAAVVARFGRELQW